MFEPEVVAQVQERVTQSCAVVTITAEGKMDLTHLSAVPLSLIAEWLRSMADNIDPQTRTYEPPGDARELTDQTPTGIVPPVRPANPQENP